MYKYILAFPIDSGLMLCIRYKGIKLKGSEISFWNILPLLKYLMCAYQY